MVKSEAPIGSFLFAQNTTDGRCHMSLTADGEAINLQIPMTQVQGMIENLARVLEADRARLAGQEETQPYLEKSVTTVIRLYNPKFGDDRKCVCGHTYERHFDGYEEPDDQDVGCKYCDCHTFVEAQMTEESADATENPTTAHEGVAEA